MAVYAEQGKVNRVTWLQRRHLNEGCTSTRRLKPLVTHADVTTLEERYGMGERSREWSPKPQTITERLDDLATWLLCTDQGAQGPVFQGKSDMLTTHRYYVIEQYEYLVTPDSVEWYWITQGADTPQHRREHRDAWRSQYARYHMEQEIERVKNWNRAAVLWYRQISPRRKTREA